MFLCIETDMGKAPSERSAYIDPGLDEIAGHLAAMTDAETVREYLEQILTESEVRDLALRWESVKMLALGHSQRKISRELGISLCKITRGSRELKKEHSVFSKILTQHQGGKT